MKAGDKLVALAALAVTSSLMAADFTWEGYLNNTYSAALNWAENAAPPNSSATRVFIPAVYAPQLLPIASASASVGLLSLTDGDSWFRISNVDFTLAVASNPLSNVGSVQVTGAAGRLRHAATGTLDLTNNGTLRFISGGNFSTATGTPGTLTQGTAGVIWGDNTLANIPYTTVIGGSLRGNVAPTRAAAALTLTNVTLGTAAGTVSSDFLNRSGAAGTATNLILRDSVVINSPLTIGGNGAVAFSSSGSTFTFGSPAVAGASVTLSNKTISGVATVVNGAGSKIISTLASGVNGAFTNNGQLVLSSGAFTATSGLTVGGTGSISMAGATTGTIVGPVTLMNNAKLDIDLGDVVAVNGAVTVAPGSLLALNLNGTPSSDFTVMTATGGFSNVPADNFANPSWNYVVEGNALKVAVPEPGTIGLVGAAGLLTLLRRRSQIA